MPEPFFVGVGLAQETAELVAPSGPPVQIDQLRSIAAVHEAAGFDAVLVGASPTAADPVVVAAEILRSTGRLGAIVSTGPALGRAPAAARSLATLDAVHPGRVSAHLPAVRSDHDARRDGLPPDRATRQRQRAEFADALVRTWTNDRPFVLDGEFERATGAWSAIRPPAALPLWVSGDSPASAALAARYGAVHLRPAPSRPVRASTPGGSPRWAVRLRPIVGSSRAAANEYADRILRVHSGDGPTRSRALQQATGALPGAGSLVGTAADVATVLLGYRLLGVDGFHLVGWQPRTDAYRYGEVIAAVRAAGSGPAPSERRTA